MARKQSIEKCDVVAVSADLAESSGTAADAQRDGGSSVDFSSPLPGLAADLIAMRELTKGWHFLLVDGMKNLWQGYTEHRVHTCFHEELGEIQIWSGSSGFAAAISALHWAIISNLSKLEVFQLRLSESEMLMLS